MERSRAPPWASTVESRFAGPQFAEPQAHQAARRCRRQLPLAPEDTTKFASSPAVQLFERLFALTGLEVASPAEKSRVYPLKDIR